jgi:hypothetical protein
LPQRCHPSHFNSLPSIHSRGLGYHNDHIVDLHSKTAADSDSSLTFLAGLSLSSGESEDDPLLVPRRRMRGFFNTRVLVRHCSLTTLRIVLFLFCGRQCRQSWVTRSFPLNLFRYQGMLQNKANELGPSCYGMAHGIVEEHVGLRSGSKVGLEWWKRHLQLSAGTFNPWVVK